MSTPASQDSFDTGLSGAELMLLRNVLSTGAPLTPERARAAVQALTTSAEYLAAALGPGASTSVPTTTDLAQLLVGLHITLHRLHAGLHQLHAGIARRAVAAGIPIVEVAALQSALGIAVDRLGTAALTVGAAGEVLSTPAAQH